MCLMSVKLREAAMVALSPLPSLHWPRAANWSIIHRRCGLGTMLQAQQKSIDATVKQKEGAFLDMAMQMDQKITVDFDVQASMRDGTILRANIYRPAGEGRWPVLLTRLPYGKDFSIGTAVMDPAQVARRGYVFIVHAARGRFISVRDCLPLLFR